METILYFVRHAESVFVEGKERTRGLSEQGMKDAETIRTVLKSEDIDLFVSSPYERSIETIRSAANEYRKEIEIEEDLRERTIGDFSPRTFKEAKFQVYKAMDFAFPGGESSIEAQKRAVRVITSIIDRNLGKKIVVGTHGDIMTLMLNYFDKQYDYIFWESTSMPDIYKLRLEGNELIEVIKMWE
ncbi:histidine phosphatase family protein [Paenibacillus lentus]|uniref:Histidine phosphatase family protein n=1 Tax=Paenibacillus lentus TaxID=1338368 RepID=A0A3S8RYE0_9BACL|nr:histidine phosphatase family protein [Paenibacillus lentus]AZK47941.1 histidine phosphatase family protein [Paenibacillus lentus]